MNGLTVTELHTQDGWDWPNGVGDERWPAGTPERKAWREWSADMEAALVAAIKRELPPIPPFNVLAEARTRRDLMELELRDRVLDDLTAKVLRARIAHPNASGHGVCSRKPGKIVNHIVPPTVPASGVREWLARDIGRS